ncbi:MAG TPA: hypothetical protein VJI67_01610, partial [archaeon]|nr:hypothetical protein [archaeon]
NASDPLRGDKLKRLEESVSESSQKLKQALTELGALSKEKEKLYSEEKKSNAGYASLEEQIKEVREQYVALKSKLSTLHASSLGKNIAIESLLAAAKRSELKGVHGPVAELCKYDSKHAQAIETAAGAKMFFIVVEDEDSAIKCINYLKENRLGRAGFIPLNKIKPPRVVSQEALGKPGVMGTALDLVGFDSRFKPAFSYVFGDTLVIDKVSRAKEVGVGVARMVSLDGDLIESSGVMLGGARDTRKATISEGKELNALNDRVSELEQEKKNAFKDLEKLRANLSVLLDSEGELELKVRELETQKKSLEAQLSELRGLQKKGLARDGKDVPTLLNEKREEMHSVSQQISTLESQKAGVEKRLQERRSTRVSLNLEDLEKQLSKLREERMAIEVEIQSTSSTQEQGLNVLKKEHEEKVAALEGEVKAFHAEISTLESRLKELEKHKEQKQVELQKSSKEVEEIQARVSVLESKAQGLAVNRGKLESRISSIRSGVTDASVRKAMFETRLLDLQREMENYPHVEPLKESAESLKDEKVVLQSKIGELGAVNMKAIEDYEVLSQRVKEIEEKINVLGKEKDAVLELIKNIDARRVNAFMSSYSSIRSNFEKMYAGMTKGKGSLKLSDDQNPLNSGLFIEASPDGRTSLKHIDALSGGEKALT